MTRSEKFTNMIFNAEGFYSNDKNDSGGETLYGIARNKNPKWEGWAIVDKYKQKTNFPNNMKPDANLISLKNALYKKLYCDPCCVDLINDELLAIHLLDFSVTSGVFKSITMLQKLMGVKPDGVIGKITLSNINGNHDYAQEFISARAAYYKSIGGGKNAKFLNGWLNRIQNTTALINKKETQIN